MNLFTVIIFILFGCADQVLAQPNSENILTAKVKWERDELDLKELKQGVPAEAIFTFTNDGDVPLIITKVLTSCGCLVASYNDQPIFPGKSSTIKVIYNAKALGFFKKTITVYSNAPQPKVLRIQGTVRKTE